MNVNYQTSQVLAASQIMNPNRVDTYGAGLLALVFLWSGISKLLNRSSSEQAFEAIGLPQARTMSWAVPIVEVVVAVALLFVPEWGGVVAFVLLAGFTTTLILILRSGRQIACGCFGGSDSKVVRNRDIIRNLLLMALALGVAI